MSVVWSFLWRWVVLFFAVGWPVSFAAGAVLAFFGGTQETARDVGYVIEVVMLFVAAFFAAAFVPRKFDYSKPVHR